MAADGAQEIAAGIWCWQRRPRGLRPGEFGTRTSYALTAGGQTLLIDPLVDSDDDPVLGALDSLAAGHVRIQRWRGGTAPRARARALAAAKAVSPLDLPPPGLFRGEACNVAFRRHPALITFDDQNPNMFGYTGQVTIKGYDNMTGTDG